VYPCGLIAWSVFNDTFYNSKALSNSPATPNMTDCVTVMRKGVSTCIAWKTDGIAWSSDLEKKFKVSSDPQPTSVCNPAGAPTSESCIALPYDSYKYFKCTDAAFSTPETKNDCPKDARYADVANEEFIVWMRTSGLPDFRKLHRIIDKDLKKDDVITLKVNNVFPVDAFSGEKRIVLSTTTWIGGKNQFLGWAYIVVSILCLLLALAFLAKQMTSGRITSNSDEMGKALAT